MIEVDALLRCKMFRCPNHWSCLVVSFIHRETLLHLPLLYFSAGSSSPAQMPLQRYSPPSCSFISATLYIHCFQPVQDSNRVRRPIDSMRFQIGPHERPSHSIAINCLGRELIPHG